MYKSLFYIVFLFTLFSCNPSVKIYDGKKLLFQSQTISSRDTTVNFGDFYITYKKKGEYVIGKVESPFNRDTGYFKSSGMVEINIENEQLKIESY